ncbi:MAG: 4Fe-4S cluster-binding domain-containing protein [Hyphomicrobiales bacterium]
MYYSHYNVIIDLDDQPDRSVIQNIFHGRASVISRRLAKQIKARFIDQEQVEISATTLEALQNKGFIYDCAEEEDALIDTTFSAFKSGLPEANPIRQYQIVLTYDCNLRCVYCFQKQVRKEKDTGYNITDEQLGRIFEVIDDCEEKNEAEIKSRNLLTRVPLIQIVGGEPLAEDKEVFTLVKKITAYAKERDFHYSITTNGVHLDKYVGFFQSIGYFPRD